MSASTASQSTVLTVAFAVLVLAGVLLDTPPVQRDGNALPLVVVQSHDSQPIERWDPARVWEELTKRRNRRIQLGANQSPQEALNEETEFEFVNTSLQDAAEFLADLHCTNIVLDEMTLANVGLSRDVEISHTLSGIPLNAALETILKPLRLKFKIEDDSIVIIADVTKQ